MPAIATSPTTFVVLVIVLVLGLCSAWAARLSEGSRSQTSSQRIFFGFLALVAGTTVVAYGLGPGYWLACGFTLSAMVLTVTCDFSVSRRAAAW